MTVKEAAGLVRKSTDTIYRWKRAGLDIQNVAALLEHSARQDENACGRSFELQLRRNGANGATQAPDGPFLIGGDDNSRKATALGVVNNLAPIGTNPLKAYFEGVDPGPDEFYELPCPFRMEQALAARAVVEEMKCLFSKRLADLRAIGHEMSISLCEEDLASVTESARLLEMTIDGWRGCQFGFLG